MSWEAKNIASEQFVMSTRNKGIISQLVTCNKARSYKSRNLRKPLCNKIQNIPSYHCLPS